MLISDGVNIPPHPMACHGMVYLVGGLLPSLWLLLYEKHLWMKVKICNVSLVLQDFKISEYLHGFLVRFLRGYTRFQCCYPLKDH